MSFHPASPRVLMATFALATIFGLTACDNNAGVTPDRVASNPQTEPTVDVAEVSKPDDMPEQILGKADAPITLIEYSSITCSTCAAFHRETLPQLKQKYIDTGKVRYIFREFPLDPVGFAAAMTARCAGEGKFFPTLDLLFRGQTSLMSTDKPEEALLKVLGASGFTGESLAACLAHQPIYEALHNGRQRASAKFGVTTAPTFFINGKIERGGISPAQLDEVLAPFLASVTAPKK